VTEHKGWIEKYRPTTLGEVVGQNKTIKELVKRIAEGSLRQNILFSGSSGVGKTTIAKILARTINCKSPIIDEYDKTQYFSPCGECSACKTAESNQSSGDFHFFDGSELGKEKLLELKKLCEVPPMYGKARIIFIDEIQNIASGRDASIQTLLKIIEQDYKGKVFFIMSTMDIKKINKAVVDRFHQHFKLKEVEPPDLIEVAQRILIKENLLEGIDFEQIQFYKEGLPVFLKEGLEVIASSANGCVREFIGYLETCVYRELYSEEEILNELEIISPYKTTVLIKMLLKKDKDFFQALREYDSSMEEFFNLSYSILTDLTMYLFTGKVRLSWQEGQFSPFKSYKEEARELMNTYTEIWSNMNGYFKSSVYLSKILDYMFRREASKGHLHTEVISSVPEVEEVPQRRRRRE